jgi:hypothetical protein
MKVTMNKLVRPLLVASGLFLLQQSVACKDDIDDIQTKINCADYCRQAEVCNGDVNRAACENDCEDALGECRANELDAVQERLDECAEESCDEFTACTIDAGARCFFGI